MGYSLGVYNIRYLFCVTPEVGAVLQVVGFLAHHNLPMGRKVRFSTIYHALTRLNHAFAGNKGSGFSSLDRVGKG